MRKLLDSLLEKRLPDIWLDHPDMFEAGESLKYDVKTIPLNKITEIAWTVTKDRKEIEKIFQSGENKLPLILVEEKDDGTYELHDGQHRYAAYVNVFPDVSHIKAAVFQRKKRKRSKR